MRGVARQCATVCEGVLDSVRGRGARQCANGLGILAGTGLL